MRPPSSWASAALLLMLSLLGAGGCFAGGGFSVDGGVFPLPVIHVVSPWPSAFGLAYEDVQLTSPNGELLYGWYIPVDNARATVLIHHGAVANRSSTAAHYRLYHELGCNVFTYDYQGFGESPQIATLDTILPDADTALAYVQGRRQAGSGPIILFGASMGTLPTFAQAARNPDGVAAIVVEGCFQPPDLPSFSFYFLGITPSPEAFLHIPQALNPDANAPLVTLPKLFMQSRADTTTLFADAQALFNASVEPKTFHEVIGGHLEAVLLDPHYEDYVGDFLDQVVGTGPPLVIRRDAAP